MQVTNSKTGVEETVRVVDHCNNGGLILDEEVFRKLDGGWKDYKQSYLIVDYEFVNCDY